MPVANEMNTKNSFPHQDFVPSAPPSYDEVVGARQNPAAFAGPSVSPGAVGSNFEHGQPSIAVPCVPPVASLIVSINVGPNRAQLRCPQCSKLVTTTIETSCQKTAHIACLILCLIGCCLCSCIPYCLESFKNVHHKCPECKAYIGTYKH